MISRNSKNMKKNTIGRTPLKSDVLHEKIQKKAYELFVKRGCVNGNDMTDWIEAERIVKSSKF